jgi:hypothetical protein
VNGSVPLNVVLEAFSEEKGDAHCPVIVPTNPAMLFFNLKVIVGEFRVL